MTKDNTNFASLADAVAIEEFYDAAVSAVRSIRETGVVIKNQVNAAATKEAVDAVVDTR
jgi:hypothetical protein